MLVAEQHRHGRPARRDTERLRAFDEVTQVQRRRHGVADELPGGARDPVQHIGKARVAGDTSDGVEQSACPAPRLSGLKSRCHFDFGSGAAHPIE
ncbi:hypothetical protein [Kutzneria sp. 744]|uniref:hypothetical protein n=1 Tax=Kutzneria sp. (strain 744) TaxID=345341 RepID=UPI0018DE2DA7|nr:hypothetical protein [Kutzneria sp. 744]